MKQKYTLQAVLILASVMLATCGLRDNAVSVSVATGTQASPLANTPSTETPYATDHPTQTPSLIPSLPPKEALEIFTGLIEKNDECKLLFC